MPRQQKNREAEALLAVVYPTCTRRLQRPRVNTQATTRRRSDYLLRLLGAGRLDEARRAYEPVAMRR